MRTLRLRITGRTQGVGYRDWARREALRLRLSGWVRNRSDGTVEALICGQGEALELFIARAREGPPAARVDDILREPSEPPAHLDFRILPSL